MNSAFERRADTVRALVRESFPTTPMYVNGRLIALAALPETPEQVTESWIRRVVREAHAAAVKDAMQSVGKAEPVYFHYTKELPQWSGLLQDLFAHAYDRLRDEGFAHRPLNILVAETAVRVWLAEMITEGVTA